MAAARLEIEIQHATTATDVPGDTALERWIRHALENTTDAVLTLRIVDERESAELNERYRGKHGPTNVLSFPAGEVCAEVGEPRPLGDLVVCAPVVEREASEQRKAADAHWAHIVVHGCLHLLGFDHEADSDAEVMEDRERELLAELGIGDPYRARVG